MTIKNTKSKLVVLFLISGIFFFFPKVAHAANFYFTGEAKNGLNSQGVLNVMLATKNENINAIESKINFDPAYLKITSINTNSVFTFFPEKSFDNKSGVINVVGGVPSPGFNGTGVAFSISFETKKEGLTPLEFNGDSRILTNTGNANVFDASNGMTIEIDKKITPTASLICPTASSEKNNRSVSSTNDENPNKWALLVTTNLLTLLVALSINMMIIKRRK